MFVDAANAGGGWVEYEWKNSLSEMPYKKIAYIMHFTAGGVSYYAGIGYNNVCKNNDFAQMKNCEGSPFRPNTGGGGCNVQESLLCKNEHSYMGVTSSSMAMAKPYTWGGMNMMAAEQKEMEEGQKRRMDGHMGDFYATGYPDVPVMCYDLTTTLAKSNFMASAETCMATDMMTNAPMAQWISQAGYGCCADGRGACTNFLKTPCAAEGDYVMANKIRYPGYDYSGDMAMSGERRLSGDNHSRKLLGRKLEGHGMVGSSCSELAGVFGNLDKADCMKTVGRDEEKAKTPVAAYAYWAASQCCSPMATSPCEQYYLNPCKNEATFKDGPTPLNTTCGYIRNLFPLEYAADMRRLCYADAGTGNGAVNKDLFAIVAPYCCGDMVSVCKDVTTTTTTTTSTTSTTTSTTRTVMMIPTPAPVSGKVQVVQSSMTIANVDYDKLIADTTAKAKLELDIKETYVSKLGSAYTVDHIKVTLAKSLARRMEESMNEFRRLNAHLVGSVQATVEVTPPAGMNAATVGAAVTNAQSSIEATTTTKVKAMPGVAELLTTGSSMEDIGTVSTMAPTVANVNPAPSQETDGAVGKSAFAALLVGVAAWMSA
jgi:hypothetical protein